MAMEKFHYEYGGKKITLPKFSNLPFGVIRKMRKVDEADQMFMLFEETADDKSLEIIDGMTVDDVSKLMEAWQEDGGVTVGESKAS